MRRIINETDTFQLILENSIDIVDYQYIFMLYQPIMGVNATNLYLTLIQEKSLTNRINLGFNHKRLMLLLNINEIELLQAFQQLETHQLLNSYYYPLKSSYIYKLQKPLSPKHFFASPKLENNLEEKLGNLQFERQKYYFLTFQPEITEDFINVTENENNYEIMNETINTTYKKEEINSSRTNLQELITKLNKSEKNDTNKENNIIINPTKNYNHPHQLRANLQSAPQTVNVANKNILNQTLNLIQEKKPEEYLVYLTKKPIDNKLKNTLNQLIFTYKLNNEVINCLLEYVWFKNNKIEPNYILKIAKTFQENNIDTINAAVNHLKLAYLKGKKNYFNNNPYRQDVLWTNDQFDFSFNKKNEKSDDNQVHYEGKKAMTSEEIKKILEEFDNH